MKHGLTYASALLLCSAVACDDAQRIVQPQSAISASKGLPGGGGGGGGVVAPPSTTPVPAPTGGTQLPPPMTTDAAAWYFSEQGGIVGPTFADINYDRMQNQSPGASPIGQIRLGAAERIFNTSKKTPLVITSITIVGPAASDFTVDPSDAAAALIDVVPPNKDASEFVRVSFTPSAEGLRTATMLVTSAAGTAEVSLSGTGLPDRPIVTIPAPFNFIMSPQAPADIEFGNAGGKTLEVDTLAIVGPNADAFVLGGLPNSPLGGCFAPSLLSPKSFCFFSIAPRAGLTTAASATLLIVSNDPIHPRAEIPITFTPQTP